MSTNLARQFLLRDDVVFLNHGSFGACPRPVFETYQRFQLELERQPVAFLGRELTERMRAPRVAPHLGRFRGGGPLAFPPPPQPPPPPPPAWAPHPPGRGPFGRGEGLRETFL